MSGVAGPSLRPRNPAPPTGRRTPATTTQPRPAKAKGRYCEVQRRLATDAAPPRTPRATTIATIRPSSSTTLPACWRVSIKKPNTKPGISERSGSLRSWVNGRSPSSRPARYISATMARPAMHPHPKPCRAASFRVTATSCSTRSCRFLYQSLVRIACKDWSRLVASAGRHGWTDHARRPLSIPLDRSRSPEPKRRASRLSGRLGRCHLEAESQPDRGAGPPRARAGRTVSGRPARPFA